MVMLDDPGTLLLLETVVYNNIALLTHEPVFIGLQPEGSQQTQLFGQESEVTSHLNKCLSENRLPHNLKAHKTHNHQIIIPLKNLSCISHNWGLPHRILRCLVVKSPQVPPGGWRAVSIFFLSSVLERVMTFVPWCGIMVESDDGGNNYCYHCFYIIVFCDL